MDELLKKREKHVETEERRYENRGVGKQYRKDIGCQTICMEMREEMQGEV